MTEDIAARRRALTDDIAAKMAETAEQGRQCGPDGMQLADVLAAEQARQTEQGDTGQDGGQTGEAGDEPAAPGTPPAGPRTPRPDASQGARGSIVDTSLEADMRRKSQQLLDMAARAAGYPTRSSS